MKFALRYLDLISHAEQKKINFYFIDAIPFDTWKENGCPPAVTNSIVEHAFPAEKLFRLPDTWCGLYYNPYPLYSTAPITKDFNCFMNRMDPFRQSWLYMLIRRGLFDQGYVSFRMQTNRLSDTHRGRDPHTVFQEQFERYCNNFQPEHEYVSKLVPYCNFTDNGDITPICYDSKVSVILETYFDDNNIITYSEKTFRALQIPRPWLLFSHRHAVKHLQKMGFDVLGDVIDHDSYDTLDSAVERQTCILDLLSTLIDSQFDARRLQHAAQHNQTLLAKFSQTWEQDIISVIDKAATHA